MYQMARLQVFVFLRLNGMYLFYLFQHCHCVFMGVCIERCHGPGTFDRLAKNGCACLIIIQMLQMFLLPEGKSMHCQCLEVMVMLLTAIRTLSYRHDYLCFSNVHRACQQYFGEPISGGGSRRQRTAFRGTNSVQKVPGSVIWYIQLKHWGCDRNRLARHCFCFCLSTGMLSLDSY